MCHNCFVITYKIEKWLIYFSIVVAALLIACEHKVPIIEKKGLNETLGFNADKYLNELKIELTFYDSPIFKNDSLKYFNELKYYYSAQGFKPVFIKSFENETLLDSILDFFEKADQHGLNLAQYHISRIQKEFKISTDTVKNPLRYLHLAIVELLLSDAVLKYSHQLRYGAVNPKQVFDDNYALSYDDSSKGDLFEPLRQKNIIKYLDDIQPKSERYRNLQVALKQYKSLKDSNWTIVPFFVKKLEVGDKNSSVNQIIQRLIALDFIDTTKLKIKNYDTYDSVLIDPVKRFQRLNGLNDDGVIGKNTVDKLNTSPEDYISKIKINLERFRWNNYKDTSFILVNIPDFRLFIKNNGQNIFTSKVCTGIKRSKYFYDQLKRYKKTKRLHDKPEDWETPVLYSKIAYMVLNPTWNVPQSIMRQEIVQNLKKDSSYLKSHNFKVYIGNESLNPDTVKIKDLLSEKNPFRIVQDPGAGNALGKIKFIFNNPYGVYLHDTPTRAPFGYSNRAVSHGCVRVEKPMPLAEYLLKNQNKWKIDFVKIEIGQKVDNKTAVLEYQIKRSELRKNASLGPTTDILLSKKVPLYIDYYTAWVDENGDVNFRDDVYNKDKILLEYLIFNHQF
jgi:murein L,D-transpeptidase YcbB/YkuD